MLKLQKDIIIDFVDSAVSKLTVAVGSVFEWVELLEKSIYGQGSLLFPKTMKKLSGLNRSPQHTIKFVKENEFFGRINSTCDHCTKDSLLIFLEKVSARPQIICCGESSMKNI